MFEHGDVRMYVCVCVCAAVCMFPYSAWRMQGPAGRLCCILHLAEHIQHIRGVTNPFLAATAFQRVSVPVNSTSPGFHTSQQMCVWHADGEYVAWRRYATVRGSGLDELLCVSVCVLLGECFRVKPPCLNGVFRVVNQRRGWGECQGVRLAPVKSPRALSLSVLTPLNLSLSSLTLTHSTSIDTGYPAALQRPAENPLQWLSIRGEPRSLQRRKDYIMYRDVAWDLSGFSGCLDSFPGICGRTKESKKNDWGSGRPAHWATLPALDWKCWIRACIGV